MPAPQNVIPLEPVTQRFPPGSPMESISTDLAVAKAATSQSGGKAGSIIILFLVVLLGIAVIFIALEVYRLRVQSRCLLQSHNMQVLDQIVNELPTDINESVNKQLQTHEERTFNVMEQQLAHYHQNQMALQAAHARGRPRSSEPVDSVQMSVPPRESSVPVQSPVKPSHQPDVAVAPAFLIETLTLPFMNARVNEQLNERPGIVIQEVSDEQSDVHANEQIPQEDTSGDYSPRVKSVVVVPSTHNPDAEDRSRSETPEIESDLEVDEHYSDEQ